MTENYFQFWICPDQTSRQIGNKNYKNLSKRNFALSKIDNFYEYFLPIFVIFIKQIIVRKIETSDSHSGYGIDLSFFCPLIMIEVSRLYDHLIKLSLIIVGTSQDTGWLLGLISNQRWGESGARLQVEIGLSGDWRGESISWLRDIDCLSLLWSRLCFLWARWLTGYPLHSDVPRNNERQVGSLAAGCPELYYGFHEVSLLKWSFLGNLGFLVALSKQ